MLIEISPMMRAGHISLPNGLGLDVQPDDDAVGVSPNELTTTDHRDPSAGTPDHKHVPARLERRTLPGPDQREATTRPGGQLPNGSN